MTTRFTKKAVATGIALALMNLPVLAQEQKKDGEDYEVIIISGTPAGVGISKKDANFAITNVDNDLIEKLAPKSTADLFKAIPGFGPPRNASIVSMVSSRRNSVEFSKKDNVGAG